MPSIRLPRASGPDYGLVYIADRGYYIQFTVGGKPERRSCHTKDMDAARAYRDEAFAFLLRQGATQVKTAPRIETQYRVRLGRRYIGTFTNLEEAEAAVAKLDS